MKKYIALCFVLALIPSTAWAQTISPPISEVVANKAGKATGELQITNNSLFPAVTTLEAHLMTLDEKGVMSMHPVPTEMDLKLTEMSFRMSAKQSHTVGWSAVCPTGCAFAIFATTATGKNTTGIGVRVLLGSTIYVYHDPKKLNPSDFSAFIKDGTLLLRNSGPDLFRPLVFVTVHGKEQLLGGYPSFSVSVREIKLPAETDSVRIAFPKFIVTATRAAQTAQK